MLQSRINRFKFDFHSIPPTFLSSRVAIFLLVFILSLGVLGFKWIEGYSWVDAIYMCIITISTVGYTEAMPLTDLGKIFTSVYIMLTVGVFAYILSVFTYYIIQGEIFKKMHTNYIEQSIEQLEDHVILCGYGRYGKEVSNHFIQQRVPFVLIERDANRIQQLRESADRVLYICDDATHDDALIKAGIERAKALISALPDDSDNVFTVLSARQLNKQLNIISRANDPRSDRKLQLAGANHVILPDQIGGFYMATLVAKPGTIEFFSFLTSEYQNDISFEEINYEDLPTPFRGLSIRDMKLREKTGTNVIGYKQENGEYVINPGPETILGPNTSLIVLGDHNQLEALRTYME